MIFIATDLSHPCYDIEEEHLSETKEKNTLQVRRTCSKKSIDGII